MRRRTVLLSTIPAIIGLAYRLVGGSPSARSTDVAFGFGAPALIG